MKYPEFDKSGMDAVLDMAMKVFDIDEADKSKLEILFTAYTGEYMKQTCRPLAFDDDTQRK